MPEDYESIAQGLKLDTKKAQVNQHVSLSPNAMAIVSQLPNSPVYDTILRIMEGELEKLETEHLKHWKNTEVFDRTGLVAVAARIFYENVQKEINYFVTEYQGNREYEAAETEVAMISPEELMKRSFGA